jgi:hypothetical protein
LKTGDHYDQQGNGNLGIRENVQKVNDNVADNKTIRVDISVFFKEGV